MSESKYGMSQYFNREEKTNMVRLYMMLTVMDGVVAYYQGGKKTDKDFLKWLRTAGTFIKKAIARRGEYMAEDAKKDWVEQCERLQVFFVPSINSRRELEQQMKLNDTVTMTTDELVDWWSAVIPHTCVRCTGKKPEECSQRQLWMKYNFPPVDDNPKKGMCQYSYIAAGIDPKVYYKKYCTETVDNIAES